MTEPAKKKKPGWPLHERRTPRPPMSRRLGLILAAVVLLYVTFVFYQADKALDRVDQEAISREEDDAKTLQLICQRQDTGLRLSLESREFISKNDEVLLTLVNVSIAPESLAENGPLTERQKKALAIFQEQAAELESQITRIDATRDELKKQLAALDCKSIPPPDDKDAKKVNEAAQGVR